MESWCEKEAYFDSSGKKPCWKRKEYLWIYSKTDFHDSRILDAANDFVKNNDIRIKYKKAIEQFVGRELNYHEDHDDQDEDDYFDRAFESIYEDFKPKQRSIPRTLDAAACDRPGLRRRPLQQE